VRFQQTHFTSFSAPTPLFAVKWIQKLFLTRVSHYSVLICKWNSEWMGCRVSISIMETLGFVKKRGYTPKLVLSRTLFRSLKWNEYHTREICKKSFSWGSPLLIISSCQWCIFLKNGKQEHFSSQKTFIHPY